MLQMKVCTTSPLGHRIPVHLQGRSRRLSFASAFINVKHGATCGKVVGKLCSLSRMVTALIRLCRSERSLSSSRLLTPKSSSGSMRGKNVHFLDSVYGFLSCCWRRPCSFSCGSTVLGSLLNCQLLLFLCLSPCPRWLCCLLSLFTTARIARRYTKTRHDEVKVLFLS